MSLADARAQTLEAKKLLQQRIDPALHKRQEIINTHEHSFIKIAEQWHNKESGRWSKDHATRVWQSLKTDALPHLGDIPVKDIRAPEILYVLRKIEDRGALDAASRIKQGIGSILRYATYMGIIDYNPVEALKDVIQTRKVQHRKAIKLEELPAFLKALDNYSGYTITKLALELIIYMFVRPGELRSAEWIDIDLENAIWLIPAEKMKIKEELIVPLSTQAVCLLNTIKELTGKYALVFPGSHDNRKKMSENTLTYAIRKRLNFDATAHGFRTVASTILNEEGFRIDVIERQLAHGDRNKVRAAYNRSQYIAERTKMMQWYNDYLDGLKNNSTIAPIGRSFA